MRQLFSWSIPSARFRSGKVALAGFAILVAGITAALAIPRDVIAREREGGRAVEGNRDPRRPTEGDAGPRRYAEGERGASRAAEGEGRRDGDNALRGFRPQTQREAALYEMILRMHREFGFGQSERLVCTIFMEQRPEPVYRIAELIYDRQHSLADASMLRYTK